MNDEHQQQLDFGEVTRRSDSISINDRCAVRTADGHRVVVVCGMVVAEHAVGDRMAEAHAMVSLVEQGWADQCDVARVFGCSARTLRRHQRRFEDGGLRALGRDCGFPRGRRRLAASRVQTVQRLKAAGHSNREIGRILGVTEKAVRKLLRRAGWKERVAVQMPLVAAPPDADPNLSAFSCGPHQEPTPQPSHGADPNLSAFSQQALEEQPSGPTGGAETEPSSVRDEDCPVSADTDPMDRRLDRLLAYLGLIDDASPLFGNAVRVPKAGVLLAVPAILHSGVLDAAKEVYGSIGPAFYGLRTTVIAMLLLALMRIKRPEALKEHSPEDLGRVLGLDRAPEVKTLRRKLKRLAARGRASRFCRALAARRVAARGAALGFLYVDGHVRVYHGKHEIPKAHVARMRLPMPSVTDYWVNDINGDPLFVVTAEANASLVKMLPAILGEVRCLVRPRRVTVVFDRGGFSPTLFHELIQDGFDILTYRKGRFRSVQKRSFSEQTATLDGRKVAYTLADQTVLLRLRKGRLRLRQVTRLTDSGHQTPILTSRRDIAAVEVAFRMFERWRQENYFKYLREEYALDALVDYSVEPDDPNRSVPNPARRKLDEQLKALRAELDRPEVDHVLRTTPEIGRLPEAHVGVRESHSAILRAVLEKIRSYVVLENRRDALPERVPVRQLVRERVVKLSSERKLLTSLIKMVAYQAESDLVRLVAPHYKRAEDEGRTLVQSALGSPADIEVHEHELVVRLAAQSSAHRTRAIAALCDELNRTEAVFPGTRLRLRYAVATAT